MKKIYKVEMMYKILMEEAHCGNEKIIQIEQYGLIRPFTKYYC